MAEPVARIREENADSFELADALVAFLANFARRGVPGIDDAGKQAWAIWNVGFVAAATRLLQAIITLAEIGLGHEAHPQVRAFLELVANQSFMADDPSTRAGEFLAQATSQRTRWAEAMEKYGLDRDHDLTTVKQAHIAEAQQFEKHFGEPPENLGTRPFNRSAYDRMREAGLEWHYDLVFSLASDVTHMGAATVDWYVDYDEERNAIVVQDLDYEPGGVLSLGSELAIRVLYKADVALEADQLYEIDETARRYWTLYGRKGITFEVVRNYLRGLKNGDPPADS